MLRKWVFADIPLCGARWHSCGLYCHSFSHTDHSKLWWMVVGENWLTLCQECSRAVFRARYCSSCTFHSFFHSGKSADRLCWWFHFYGCCASPGVKLQKQSQIRHHDMGQWCDLWGMKSNVSKTRTMIVSRSRTMHPHVTPIKYWWNCTEGVWWYCYIGSDIWFQDDFWAPSSLGF